MLLVELPSLYLDEALQSIAVRPYIVKELPGDQDVQVPAGTLVELDIVDIGTNGIDLSTVDIYVDGQLAFQAGIFQTGWDGPSSAYTPLTSMGAGGADGLNVVIDPTSDFQSTQVVTVRVLANINTPGGNPLMDVTYSFTIEDTIEPEVESALSVDQKIVRVAFNEPLKMQGDGDPADALTASNYSFQALNDTVTPAVEVAPVAVEQIDSDTVEVTLDWEITPLVQYRVTVQNVEDLTGNAIGPVNTAEFQGFKPATPARRNFNLYRMLPQINRDEDDTQDLLRFINCWQELVNLILAEADRWSSIYDIDTAPELFVDAILQDLGNPFAFDLTLNQKRKLARILVVIYQLKGTETGIRTVLRFFLDIEATVEEFADEFGWYLGDGELGIDTWLGSGADDAPYSFDVMVDRALSSGELDQLEQIVDFLKPAHTHHKRTVQP